MLLLLKQCPQELLVGSLECLVTERMSMQFWINESADFLTKQQLPSWISSSSSDPDVTTASTKSRPAQGYSQQHLAHAATAVVCCTCIGWQFKRRNRRW